MKIREYLTEDSHGFCRSMKSGVLERVKEVLGKEDIKKAWVHGTKMGSRKMWQFHFKDYNWYGQADCSADAYYQGWKSWLESEETGGRKYKEKKK
jgi:hypothetical protein